MLRLNNQFRLGHSQTQVFVKLVTQVTQLLMVSAQLMIQVMIRIAQMAPMNIMVIAFLVRLAPISEMMAFVTIVILHALNVLPILVNVLLAHMKAIP